MDIVTLTILALYGGCLAILVVTLVLVKRSKRSKLPKSINEAPDE